MLSPPPHPFTVPGYEARPPTEADVRAALGRVFGPDRGAERWSQACGAAGLSVGRVSDATHLERATQALAGQGGASAAVARSIEIRMRTYTRLAARAGAMTHGGQG